MYKYCIGNNWNIVNYSIFLLYFSPDCLMLILRQPIIWVKVSMSWQCDTSLHLWSWQPDILVFINIRFLCQLVYLRSCYSSCDGWNSCDVRMCYNVTLRVTLISWNSIWLWSDFWQNIVDEAVELSMNGGSDFRSASIGKARHFQYLM